MSLFIITTVIVPTFCYLGAALVLFKQGQTGDAIMFSGYAFANVGILWRLYG